MKPKGQTFSCIICHSEVDHLHEIFFGRFRKTSIKYNIQAPVCICSHPWRIHHSGDSYFWKRRLCRLMEIDYEKTLLALNTNDTEYLEKISVELKKKLDLMLV